jgi:hypothetical protein
MNNLWDQEEFCKDLTRDVLSEDELTQLCRSTVRCARRVRVMGQLKVVSLFVLLAVAAWEALKPRLSVVVEVAPPKIEQSYKLVQSEQFPYVINSQSYSAANFFAGIEPAPVLESSGPNYRLITDEQLLKFFVGKAVALVKFPGGRMELEFLENVEIDKR